MNKRSKTIAGILFLILAAFLVARYVLFPEQFTERSDGLQRIEDWQTQYKIDNPNATPEEINQAFEEAIGNLEAWKEDYKTNNPGATDADADQAFNEAWGE